LEQKTPHHEISRNSHVGPGTCCAGLHVLFFARNDDHDNKLYPRTSDDDGYWRHDGDCNRDDHARGFRHRNERYDDDNRHYFRPAVRTAERQQFAVAGVTRQIGR